MFYIDDEDEDDDDNDDEEDDNNDDDNDDVEYDTDDDDNDEEDDDDADLREEGWHSEPVVDNGECGVGVDRHVEHYEPAEIKCYDTPLP